MVSDMRTHVLLLLLFGEELTVSWAVCGPMMDRARGARGPLTLRLAGTPERRNERNTEQRKCYPFLLVGSNRQTKSPVGLQKGSILPI